MTLSTFFRIGNLSVSDAAAQAKELAASDNPFASNFPFCIFEPSLFTFLSPILTLTLKHGLERI